MKTLIHRWLLGLTLLSILPGTFLACLLVIGAAGSFVQNRFQASDFLIILVLLIPTILIWSGLWLLAGLRQGVHQRLRRQLLAFYLTVFAYCSFWILTMASRGGIEVAITVSAIFIIPVLITLFTKAEEKREWNPLSGKNFRSKRPGDRFVAWLASRMR